jgi:hypothetical protein
MDAILKSVHKLLVSIDTVNVSNKGGTTNEYSGGPYTTINSRSITENRIARNIACRKLYLPILANGVRYTTSVLGQWCSGWCQMVSDGVQAKNEIIVSLARCFLQCVDMVDSLDHLWIVMNKNIINNVLQVPIQQAK